MVIGQAEEDDDVVEVLDQHVRELVRQEGVDPQRDARLVRRIAEGVVRERHDRSLTGAVAPVVDIDAVVGELVARVSGFGALQPFLAALREAGHGWLSADPNAQIALVGDWNVAPKDEDVWSMAAFEGSTHVSAPERAAFNGVVDAGFADVVRPHTPGAFTYWDYRAGNFHKNLGMRIDLVYATPAVADAVTDAYVDREARKGKGPSDHAPVVVDLAL